jgi:acetyltransferase
MRVLLTGSSGWLGRFLAPRLHAAGHVAIGLDIAPGADTHMSREDVRLRFFTPMRELKHALAARLSHLDYSREMALVAQHDGMTLGVARYSADPDRRSAEFAVAVRSDWHGRGVGQLLMARLIEVAQQSGISELIGLVLHENKPMLKMCRKLGFSIAPEPNDATVLRVRKSLAPV